MSDTGRLANAPLIEVIAEVHWGLPAGPMGEFDPEWFDVQRLALDALRGAFPIAELLQPAGYSVPLEVLGRAPLVRLRSKPNAWPVVQLGQGLLTFNVVPPYDGWTNIKGQLCDVIAALVPGVPALARRPLKAIRLHYRDAFRARHDAPDPIGFLRASTGLTLQDRLAKKVRAARTMATGQITLQLEEPAGAVVVVGFGDGQYRSAVAAAEPAAVFDGVVTLQASGIAEAGSLMQLFERAHDLTHVVFDTIVPDQIQPALNRQQPEEMSR